MTLSIQKYKSSTKLMPKYFTNLSTTFSYITIKLERIWEYFEITKNYSSLIAFIAEWQGLPVIQILLQILFLTISTHSHSLVFKDIELSLSEKVCSDILYRNLEFILSYSFNFFIEKVT